MSLRLEAGRVRGPGRDYRRDEAHAHAWLIPGCVGEVGRSSADRRNFLFLVLKCSRTVSPKAPRRSRGRRALRRSGCGS